MILYTVFALIALAILLFIAAELYILTRELSRAITLILKKNDIHENATPGQTINVNLGAGVQAAQAGTQAIGGSVQTDGKIKEADRETPDMEEEAEKKKGFWDRGDEEEPKKATQTGPFAVKCPKCQSENSSYRTECFNCGFSLK